MFWNYLKYLVPGRLLERSFQEILVCDCGFADNIPVCWVLPVSYVAQRAKEYSLQDLVA
jgi:hypothetical protein